MSHCGAASISPSAAARIALATRALAEVRLTGARPRRTAPGGTRALTEREREVAVLAARGLSNREIAESLVVTVKTVEWHLRHAFRKLGIDSRAKLGGLPRGGLSHGAQAAGHHAVSDGVELADVVAVHLKGERAVVHRVDPQLLQLPKALDLSVAQHRACPGG